MARTTVKFREKSKLKQNKINSTVWQFPETSDWKRNLQMPENRLTGKRKELVLILQWPLGLERPPSLLLLVRKSTCTLVVYWPPTPPNMPFQRRRKCIFHWRGRAWLTIWDGVKIPRYSHRLMHQKRVTSELHDSYFRLMTIKHAIPKIVEVHIPMASYGEILSDRKLLYNWVHRKFNQFGEKMR